MTLKRKTPIKRSSKPIKRSAVKKARSKPRPGRLKGKAMTELRREVFERDLYQCQHVLNADGLLGGYSCRKRVTWETGHLAHIVSRGRGGKDTPENCLTKCQECHMIREHHEGGKGKIVPKKERPT